MLKLPADPAEGFGADTQVGRNAAKGNSFEHMRGLVKQIFIAFFGRFKLRVHKSFFQADIIFFISDPYESFNFVVFVEQAC